MQIFKGAKMTSQALLDKYQYHPYVVELIQCASRLPIQFPKERKDILWEIEEMAIQTHKAIEDLAFNPLANHFERGHLTDSEVFVLWCRWACALDMLARVTDALPSQSFLSISNSSESFEIAFLISGLWKEFGQYWMGQRAWRIEQGHPEPFC